MITIATITFIKITLAILKGIRHRNGALPIILASDKVCYAEVFVSFITMQQSMLVSFGKTDEKISDILNIFTGLSVCVFIFLLGIITLKTVKKEK